MNFPELIIYIYNIAITIGGFLAFVVIVFSGVKLLNSQGNPSALSESKKRIINSLIGLAVLLGSYIILSTINPDIMIIKDIKLGDSGFSFTITTPGETESATTFKFQEIPIATLVEQLLAANSSTVNLLPCYEYEHRATDSSGNIIIGNTIDQNGDGQINEKDILLDKDIFYCMKLLGDATQKKTEQHLNVLIKELDNALQKCTCTNCSEKPLQIPYGYECEYRPRTYTSAGECSYCQEDDKANNCGCYGGPNGYENIRPDGNSVVEDYGTFKQYKYDPCPNRLEINCKRQMIKMLVNGTVPDSICYQRGYIKESAPKSPILLTLEESVKRYDQFKDYFVKKEAELESAEKTMKNSVGEKITLQEFIKIQNEEKQYTIDKTESPYGGTRYCTDFRCEDSSTGKCTLGSLSPEKRICNSSAREHFLFDGDPGTFYLNPDYGKATKTILDNAEKVSSFKTCSVADGDITKGNYAGLIPIGEAVDEAEAWAKEVPILIDKTVNEINNIAKQAISISELSQSCDCSRCENKNIGQIYMCREPCCCTGEDCCECWCGAANCIQCKTCQPRSKAYDSNGYMIEQGEGSSPCRVCPPAEPPKFKIYQNEKEWFVCPYYIASGNPTNFEVENGSDFCSLVKNIYYRGEIDSDCFENTLDEEESSKRPIELNKLGYLQRFEERQKRLLDFANVKEIRDDKQYESLGTYNLINGICPSYSEKIKERKEMSCDGSLNHNNSINNRFAILEKLSLSRERLKGCITGYGHPNKDDSARTRIFTCKEGINLTILKSYAIYPNFPYPFALTYYNCYPYNVSNQIKTTCFNNKDRPGTAEKPGCEMLTADYMDNYYCCK